MWNGEYEHQIDGLVQDCSISSALAMEILQSCTKSSKWNLYLSKGDQYQTMVIHSRVRTRTACIIPVIFTIIISWDEEKLKFMKFKWKTPKLETAMWSIRYDIVECIVPTWFILIPAWISNYTHYEMWNEIIYPFAKLNGCTVEVWKWICNFIPHFCLDMWIFIHAGIKINPC